MRRRLHLVLRWIHDRSGRFRLLCHDVDRGGRFRGEGDWNWLVMIRRGDGRAKVGGEDIEWISAAHCLFWELFKDDRIVN